MRPELLTCSWRVLESGQRRRPDGLHRRHRRASRLHRPFPGRPLHAGLRIPLTAERDTFAEAVELGRTVIWLHTFGERMADPERPPGPAAAAARSPQRPNPPDGAIPQDPAAMPDTIDYDADKKTAADRQGYVENVEPAVWNYEVSGKQVSLQWFSYRKANRERPIIGDRRPPSPLGNIQPDHWLAEYTTELINVLNVLGCLVDLEPAQAALLEKICAGPTITAGARRQPKAIRSRGFALGLFGGDD